MSSEVGCGMMCGGSICLVYLGWVGHDFVGVWGSYVVWVCGGSGPIHRSGGSIGGRRLRVCGYVCLVMVSNLCIGIC